MKPRTPHSRAAAITGRRGLLTGALLMVAAAYWHPPGRAADPGLNTDGHNHGTNLTVYVDWRTNFLRLHYYVQPTRTCVLEYLPISGATYPGGTPPNSAWANLPGTQAPRLPQGYNYEMRDYSVTNRHPTNLGRLYRLRMN